MTEYLRYRDFIANLEIDAEGDDTTRIVDSRHVADVCDTWLCLRSGKDGGVAFLRTRKGYPSPTNVGVSLKIDPTVSMTALAAALATPEMMSAARSILTPGSTDPVAAVTFAEGLRDLRTNPYPEAAEAPRAPLLPVQKPPSLDAVLWDRIPNSQRREYIKAMAHGLVRRVHPDDTVADLLAAA
ncbi:hypothetical protein [Agrobacterium genomosp. 2]|uniref:Uncharacterized protein n=1 Tax=Agrobacterium genomosp. 2 str. CFBP 5494 TaxID=1183436 RepID=A0A9W5B2K3_9HYPH|nr:hypothetical protein [Agrobacterium genomosp. 2]CUW93677.1 hypothetical protein AGR2A_Cc70080 [Agrobacterium genomosp. 2 str. CFBP 5494]